MKGVHREVELRGQVLLVLGLDVGGHVLLHELVVVADEDVEVLAQDVRRVDERLVRIDAAVGRDLEDQLLVVGVLADAAVGDLEVHAGDRRVDAVDRNHADLGLAGASGRIVRIGLPRRRAEAAAAGDLDVHVERAVGVDGRDVVGRVEDLDAGAFGGQVGGRDLARALAVDRDDAGLVGGALDEDLLEGEDDLGHVLLHAGQRAELVRGALDADGRNREALDGGKQHAAEGVADRARVADFEGFGRVAPEGRRRGGLLLDDVLGHFEIDVEANGHVSSSFLLPGAPPRGAAGVRRNRLNGEPGPPGGADP